MKIIISAKLQGLFESYKILVDDEVVQKVRGDKVTTLEVSDEEHTLQLKGGSGKSSIVKILPEDGKDTLNLHFITHYSRAFKEGYFELEDAE